MAEFSLPWTTDAATPEGDQQASYTQTQLAILHKIVAACSNFEGVAPGFLNELEVDVAGANTVSVATGGAMVDGIVYHNDASQNVNIPGAVGSGNTRIDRIVLRADWAGFNVSVHRIAGVDAASPTAPAITQNSGTIYDITVAQVLVDTAGNCTVTGEKLFAAAPVDGVTLEEYNGSLRVKAGGIATGNIANDAVDDTKVGNRVPQFYRRQGGNATNWYSPGSTNYVPGPVRIQAGRADLIDEPLTITFPVPFSGTPIVFITQTNFSGETVYISALSASAMTLTLTSAPGLVTLSWLAIGPE
ncbi:MAG: hypothetical protein PHR35_22400 [Kiritimatiellae bacterium]|nr:hypothetical protein [Kiritimatiellia bacterium]